MDYPYIDLTLAIFLASLVSFGVAIFLIGHFRLVATCWRGELRELHEEDVVSGAMHYYRGTRVGKAHFLLLILASGALAISACCIVVGVKFGQ